jgi:replicative DNA helicase
MYATEDEISQGNVLDTDAELIWRKNRQGPTGTGKVFFDPAKMNIH